MHDIQVIKVNLRILGRKWIVAYEGQKNAVDFTPISLCSNFDEPKFILNKEF